MVRVPAPRPPTPNKHFDYEDDAPRHPLGDHNQKHVANDKRTSASGPAPAFDRENVAFMPDMSEEDEDSDTGTIKLGPSRARSTQAKPRELKRTLSKKGDLSPSVGSPSHPSAELSPIHVFGKFGDSDTDVEDAPAPSKTTRAAESLRRPTTPHRLVPSAPPATPHGYVSVNCQKYFTGGRAGRYPQRSATTGHIEAWDSNVNVSCALTIDIPTSDPWRHATVSKIAVGLVSVPSSLNSSRYKRCLRNSESLFVPATLDSKGQPIRHDILTNAVPLTLRTDRKRGADDHAALGGIYHDWLTVRRSALPNSSRTRAVRPPRFECVPEETRQDPPSGMYIAVEQAYFVEREIDPYSHTPAPRTAVPFDPRGGPTPLALTAVTIPAGLFERSESRMFKFEVRVELTMASTGRADLTHDAGAGGPLRPGSWDVEFQSGLFSVSVLRSSKDMVFR